MTYIQTIIEYLGTQGYLEIFLYTHGPLAYANYLPFVSTRIQPRFLLRSAHHFSFLCCVLFFALF